MDLLRWLFRGIRSKRGSPTVEYVFVMVAATMLAGIVVGIVKSEPVQASLRQVILCSVPFLYDENGEPSCKAGKYMAKEDPKPEKPDPPEDEFSPIPLHTKPESTPPVKPVKSDPPWYECALSWDCIKKKGGELKDHYLEKIRGEAIQHCGQDADCIRDYLIKRIGADTSSFLIPGVSSLSDKWNHVFGVDPWFEIVSFVVDHPTFSLATVATIIALFVSPPLGGTMLVSGAISGGVSWLQGNDSDTILRDMGIGGFAGVFGYGVFAGVTRYAGAKLAQSTLNPFLQKWLPKIIGGGSGGVADQSTFDWLRDRKLDWRSATLAGMIGLLIPYAGAIIDGSPALGKSFQQMIPGISGDGTLAMPWVKKNGQEAADQYQYISPEDWEKMTPEQKAKVNEGNAFNTKMSPKYPHNEVYVKYKDKKGRWQNGKVDSYDPDKGEIISRKHTQLAEIQYQTARDYMNEFLMKYAPGTRIRDVPTQRPGSGHQNADLAGGTLEGRMILEVPVQKKPVPKEVLEYAKKNRITIRDEKGKVLGGYIP